jgi:hypothetical protein
MLSPGGNIVPTVVKDYEDIETFHYTGIIPTENQKISDVAFKPMGEIEAKPFASRVYHRALDPCGARRPMPVYLGILLQIFRIGAILMACWLLESVSIVVW